jgi:hypothetical protein
MNKEKIRLLKSHYMARWTVLRNNQKHVNKILALEDQIVLKNLMPGTTLCYNCLGEIYNGMIDMTPSKKYQNLVLINNREFKYKTVDQLNDYVQGLAEQFLLSGGRIIVSVSHRFLIYNRVELSVNTLLAQCFSKVNKFTVIKSLNLLNKANQGYGDYFFCINYQ